MDMHSLQQDIVSQSAKPLQVCYLQLLLPKMFYLPNMSNACFTLEREGPVQGWACEEMLDLMISEISDHTKGSWDSAKIQVR